MLLSDEEIAALSPAEVAEYEAILEAETAAAWEEIARPGQLPPAGDWHIWLVLAGRGWGKTRTGAEWAADKARRYPGARIALVGQTFADGRDTMVEGETGLLSVLRESELRRGSVEAAWNRSIGELYMANGSRFRIFSSEKPNRLRGPQHHFAWGDEPATWLDAREGPEEETTWSNLELGLRLTINGSEPQVVLTGTPKAVRLLTQRDREPVGLLHRDSTAITGGHTDENLDNLAASFRERVVDRLRGTRLGRQELAAELLEDVEGALWQGDWFERPGFRVAGPPHGGWRRAPMVGVDPADGTAGGAEHAFTVVALGNDHKLYVVENEGVRGSVNRFAHAAIDAASRHGGRIIVEKNHGGAWLVEVFERAMIDKGVRVPLETVHAAQGKLTRAEPVAALYEQNHVRHIGQHPELEDQMTGWDGSGPSPDRMDSLVWAAGEFTGETFGPASSESAVVPWSDAPTPGVHRYRHRDPLQEGTDGLERWESWPGEFGNWSDALDAWVHR